MHSLLARQIKDTLGEIDISMMTGGWKRFFEVIDKTYYSADEERTLLDRSLEISSREYREIHQRHVDDSSKKDSRLLELEMVKDEQLRKIAQLEIEVAALKQKITQ